MKDLRNDLIETIQEVPYEDPRTIILEALLKDTEVQGCCSECKIRNLLTFVEAVQRDILEERDNEALDRMWLDSLERHPSQAGEISE